MAKPTPNQFGPMAFDIETTRRLSTALLVSASGFLFAAFQLIGAGISADDTMFAKAIASTLPWLLASLFFGAIAFIFAELAAYPGTPSEGHPHSKRNYLQSAFVFICFLGLGALIWGVLLLVVTVSQISGNLQN